MDFDEQTVRQALEGLYDPAGQPLLQSTHFAGLHVQDGRVSLALNIAGGEADVLHGWRSTIEQKLKSVPGVTRLLVTLTAEKPVGQPLQAPRLPDIRFTLAIASGKGGVGKSTTAANLALAFRARGFSVGLLDADIYGPSQPHLFALDNPPEQNDDGKLEPAHAHGIKIMSIGMMVEKNMPLIWRGPMLDKVLKQFLHDVNWGALDILLIDMPPGTGDAQISLTRRIAIDGAIIVSTPQDLALIDARKGVALFQETGVPVLGLIENMSTFICPDCGTRCDIFSAGGARKQAEALSIPFLGEIPLHLDIRKSADAGVPLVTRAPQGPQARAYFEIADSVLEKAGLTAADALVNKA